MSRWFVTWNRAEYKEWAIPKPYGYLLLILRRQAKNFLVAKAKLVVGKSGFPGFKPLKTELLATKTSAMALINQWKKSP